MKITIDTSQDSKEDIRKIVALLSNYLSGNESSVINNSSNGVFPEPVSEAGFFGAEINNNTSLGTSTSVDSSSQSNILSNNNNLSNNRDLSVSNASSQQTQEQSVPFMNIFGDESSVNSGVNNSNSGNNVLSNNSSTNSNPVSGTTVSSQPSPIPDIFSVFGNANNSSQNNPGSIHANNNSSNNTIVTGGNNLGNNTAASPKKTFAGIFKGIPILGNINFGQDEQHDELTEEEKVAAKKVVEY